MGNADSRCPDAARHASGLNAPAVLLNARRTRVVPGRSRRGPAGPTAEHVVGVVALDHADSTPAEAGAGQARTVRPCVDQPFDGSVELRRGDGEVVAEARVARQHECAERAEVAGPHSFGELDDAAVLAHDVTSVGSSRTCAGSAPGAWRPRHVPPRPQTANELRKVAVGQGARARSARRRRRARWDWDGDCGEAPAVDQECVPRLGVHCGELILDEPAQLRSSTPRRRARAGRARLR